MDVSFGEHLTRDRITFNADGTVEALTSFDEATQPLCTGDYFFEDDGSLFIQYDGLQGPGTGGGCHNDSTRLILGDTDLNTLESRVKVPAQTQRFYMADGEAHIEPVKP